MDKELVVIVPNEEAAYQVVRTLKALDDEGSIELYLANVITKTATGVKRIEESRHIHPPLTAALGATTGALIGFLGGPVGAAIGAAIGGAVGLGGDLAYTGIASDFVYDVAKRLPQGGCAVIASVWEDWTVPVDVAMAPYGGGVLRQTTDDVVIAQIRADMQTLKDEEAHVEAEIAKASGEAKAKLVAQRDALRAKQTAQRERLRARASKLEAEWNARIDSIKAKTAVAKADAKQRHELHVQKLARASRTYRSSRSASYSPDFDRRAREARSMRLSRARGSLISHYDKLRIMMRMAAE